MRSFGFRFLLGCFGFFAGWGTALVPEAAEGAAPRERILLDPGWRFAFGHATDSDRDFGHGQGYFSYLAKAGYGDGAAHPAFDDRGWRLLDLPHDWAVEAPFDGSASKSHGYKAIGPGFPERSIGWYRRHFIIPDSDIGRRIRLQFDGAYRDARVFVNGFFVGQEPSGYLEASYDVTDYLNYGGDNVVAVRVDASMEEGWYYEGAGIYRHVWLVKTAPLHVARHGTWVRTQVSAGMAELTIETTLRNEELAAAKCVLEEIVVDPNGEVVAEKQTEVWSLPAGGTSTQITQLQISDPQLWSLETPVLHTLITVVRREGQVVDRYETPFGIRTIHFDPDAGFFLNGRRVEIKGTNNHQDHAGVGIALPDAVQEFRVRRLQAMGSNTYRTAHHPPTPELLDACDRLGMLVINENRLMGINDQHRGQLEALIRRDRNHPSVILWSIGNEEWAIEGNSKGAQIAATMQAWARNIDPTRLATVGVSGGWGGISTVIDVMGVNYIRHGDTDEQHRKFPEQIILGTEETTTQGTRGIYVDDPGRAHLAPVKDGSSGGNAETGWQYYAARPYLAGLCYWTGFDYRGEPTPFEYPAISSQFGILDTCGFPKHSFHYLKSWWDDEIVLHLAPHWNWPGREGETITVRADSNCDEVELFLNGRSVGRQTMPRNGHLEWPVTYTPGELVARGYRNGEEIAVATVATTGPAAAVALIPDRSSIRSDGRDVAMVTVEVRDGDGRLVPTANQNVIFSLTGPGRIIGVGNGDPSSHERDRFVSTWSTVNLGSWTPPDAAEAEGETVFEATFERPATTAIAHGVLLLNALGPRQSVFLNGRALYTDAAPAQSRREVSLAELDLNDGENTLRVVATRYADWGLRDSLARFHPATLVFKTAVEPWHRSVFNGLAQVIVQSTGEPGRIRLEAICEDFPRTSVELITAPLR